MKDNSVDLLALRSRAGQSRPGVAARPRCRGGRATRTRKSASPSATSAASASRRCRWNSGLPTATARRFPTAGWGRRRTTPRAGLLLKFVGDLVYLVLLEGSNLNALVNGAVSLYDRGIQRHRVTWVREMTRQQVEQAGEGEVTVERIRVLSHRPDEEPKAVEWLRPFRRHTDG